MHGIICIGGICLMIKCERCNIEMLENAEVIGQHTFEVEWYFCIIYKS